MSNIFGTRDYYKPFDYPWAFDYYKLQSINMHWVPEDVTLHEDVRDFNNLSESDKSIITNLMLLFTQSDVDVGSGYFDKYIPKFKLPELRMMLGSFANMESVHQHAYSHLTDTLGLPESTYKGFHEYEAMVAKHEYLMSNTDELNSLEKLLRDIAVYSAFTEGLQLFSSFAILLKFPHQGKMKGLGQIVSYSIKDESLHVEGMVRIYHQIVKENPTYYTEKVRQSIVDTCKTMVELEWMFVDKVFELGDMEGLPKESIKQYNLYIADRRLLQLGLEPIYGVKDNPLPWLNEVLGVEFADFFSTRPTSYQKGGLKGDRDSVVFTNQLG